ncbi:MAG: hypothetical protein J6Y78_03735 [Paludibacteraceae bacterium]|nr:hypothetical protein [Paludibacteraceae bacterium]
MAKKRRCSCRRRRHKKRSCCGASSGKGTSVLTIVRRALKGKKVKLRKR